MTLDLKEALLSHPCDLVAVSDKISDQWISALFDLKGMTNPIHRKIVPSMYRAIPKRTVCDFPYLKTERSLPQDWGFLTEIILESMLSTYKKVFGGRGLQDRSVQPLSKKE